MARPIVTPSEETIKQVSEEIAGRTAEELKKEGDEQTLYMKKIALDFIQVVNTHIEKIQIIESNALRLKQMRHQLDYSKNKKDPGTVATYMAFKEELERNVTIDLNMEEFFKASMIFNDRILEIITGKPTLVSIVIPDAESGPIVMEMTIEEMLAEGSGITIRQDITSGKSPQLAGRLQYDLNIIKNNLRNNIHKDNVMRGASLQGLNLAYDTALATYGEYKPYVFWKPLGADSWFKMNISSAGDISEAYAYFFHTGGEIFLDHLYNNLDTFYRQGVAMVDAVSGLYSSDVITENYNYAVKSLDASLPGFRQMILLANRIVNGKIASVQQSQQISFKKEYKDAAGTIRKGLRNKIETIADDIVPDEIKISLG